MISAANLNQQRRPSSGHSTHRLAVNHSNNSTPSLSTTAPLHNNNIDHIAPADRHNSNNNNNDLPNHFRKRHSVAVANPSNTVSSQVLESLQAPVFPLEKNFLEIPADVQPILQTSSITAYIKLAESVLFLQGFANTKNAKSLRNDLCAPAILRGALILKFTKPTRLKNISLQFKGEARTDWPEGIPPKKQEFMEVNSIMSHTWPFFTQSSNLPNCGASMFIPQSKQQNLLNQSNNNNSSSHHSLHRKNSVSSKNNNSSNNIRRNSLIPSSPKLSSILPQQHSLISDFLSHTFTSNNNNQHDSNNHHHHSNNNLNHSHTAPSFKESNNNNNHNGINSLNSSNTSPSIIHNSNTNINSMGSSSDSNNIFQPGTYIYTFEQPIPASCPESIRADFGYVEYDLNLLIERIGTFKSNLAAKLPVTIVRTNADSSVEETEPIAISRDWESHLHYDVVIASKDIILDAFLPIHFHFQPLDKVAIHRIRIYLTESLDYYCKGKKVHRVEPTKKYLLSELNGPKLDNLPSNTNFNKAKNRGNLLIEEYSNDLVGKDFDFEVFIPTNFNSHQCLHPDTSYEKIKSSHWIKIALRLSKLVNGKTKHYEISIDSPIHVLNKLCAHANTLLPAYNSHQSFSVSNNNITMNNSSIGPPAYNTKQVTSHESNFFFPKDVLSLAEMNDQTNNTSNNSKHHNHHNATYNNSRRNSLNLSSPRLKPNVYQPDSLSRNLISPQAVPLSPMLSPNLILSPNNIQDSLNNPPPFDFSKDDDFSLNSTSNSTTTTNNNNGMSQNSNSSNLPRDPPTYNDVLKRDGVFIPPSKSTPLRPRNLTGRPIPPPSTINVSPIRRKSLTAVFGPLKSLSDHNSPTIPRNRSHSALSDQFNSSIPSPEHAQTSPTITTTNVMSPNLSPSISPSNNPFLKPSISSKSNTNIANNNNINNNSNSDIATGFRFKDFSLTSPNFSGSATNRQTRSAHLPNTNPSESPNSAPLDFIPTRRKSIQDQLPATVKYDNFSFAGMNEVLSGQDPISSPVPEKKTLPLKQVDDFKNYSASPFSQSITQIPLNRSPSPFQQVTNQEQSFASATNLNHSDEIAPDEVSPDAEVQDLSLDTSFTLDPKVNLLINPLSNTTNFQLQENSNKGTPISAHSNNPFLQPITRSSPSSDPNGNHEPSVDITSFYDHSVNPVLHHFKGTTPDEGINPKFTLPKSADDDKRSFSNMIVGTDPIAPTKSPRRYSAYVAETSNTLTDFKDIFRQKNERVVTAPSQGHDGTMPSLKFNRTSLISGSSGGSGISDTSGVSRGSSEKRQLVNETGIQRGTETTLV